MNSTTITTPDTLVCGVDDSAHAVTVVAVAGRIAHQLGLRLRLVHSVHPNAFRHGSERDSALARGRELLATLGADPDDDAHVVELGDPASLFKAVLEEGAALTVVGSRGRGPARAALLGSISNAVIASAPCPVVVVPPHAVIHVVAPPTVICGLDGSSGAAAALQSAAALASGLGGRLVALHASTAVIPPMIDSVGVAYYPQPAPLKDLRAAVSLADRRLAELNVEVPAGVQVETGDAAAALAAAAAEEDSAILVVGTRGQGPVRSALLGSVSARLAATAPVPVMIVPPTARALGDALFDRDEQRGRIAPAAPARA
jgi:nucleotide-binding universal stress UspA family protein